MFANLDKFTENVPENGISILKLQHFRWKIRNLRSKYGFMRVRIDSQDDMIQILTEIYDNRLKALIGYEDTECTREIVGYMFSFFSTISKLSEIDALYILPILRYTPDDNVSWEYAAINGAKGLIPKLETYIKTCVDILYPDWRQHFKKDEYRKVLGIKFKEEVNKNKDKYPSKLLQNDFFSQLNYTTQYRNIQAHDLDENFVEYCDRFYILQAYDILLTFLLYTFYYMVLKKKKDSTEPEYIFKHLTPVKK